MTVNTGISILLLENRPEDVQKFETLLSDIPGQNFRLEASYALQEGLALIRINKTDVILAALNLRDEHGESIFQKLHEAAPQIPIFIVGDEPNEALALKLVGAGAHDYLVRTTFSSVMLSRVLRYAIERKKVEKKIHLAEEKYRTVFEKSAVAITLTDKDKRLISWNRHAEELLGMQYDDLYLKPVNLLYPAKEWQRIQQFHAGGRGGDEGTLETQVLCKGGQILEVELSISLLRDPDGLETGSIGILRDISERKKVERMKDEFIGTVSHELRTPLTIIRESVSQILDQIHGPVNEDQKMIMQLSLEGVDRLVRIVNDLLDISKLEAGKVQLHREYLDLSEAAASVCRAFSAKAASRRIRLESDFPPQPVYGYADRDKIIQVLMNLIGNALKFTDQGSVRVSVEASAQAVQVCVEDTGSGMTESDCARLFQKFEQFGRAAGPGEKGTGLGLAISKGIIDLHHGRIWAESSPGKGSRFYFSLPLQTARDFFLETAKEGLQRAVLRSESLALVEVLVRDFERVEKKTGLPAWMHGLAGLETQLKKELGRPFEFFHNGRQGMLLLLPKTSKHDALVVSGRLQQSVAHLLQDLEAEGAACRIHVQAYPEDSPHPGALLDKLGIF